MPRDQKDMPSFAGLLPSFVREFMKATPPSESDPTLGIDEHEPDDPKLAKLIADVTEGIES